MPESKIHRFLKRKIIPTDFLYENLGVYFTSGLDKKLGRTFHRPDIYCYSHKGSVRKNVLLLGEVETGSGNLGWNLEQTEPVLEQQWAHNTILFQVFYPKCNDDLINESIEEGKRLARKHKGVHFYPFEMKIDKERTLRLYDAFENGRKRKNDLRVLSRETNKINKALLEIINKYLVRQHKMLAF